MVVLAGLLAAIYVSALILMFWVYVAMRGYVRSPFLVLQRVLPARVSAWMMVKILVHKTLMLPAVDRRENATENVD